MCVLIERKRKERTVGGAGTSTVRNDRTSPYNAVHLARSVRWKGEQRQPLARHKRARQENSPARVYPGLQAKKEIISTGRRRARIQEKRTVGASCKVVLAFPGRGEEDSERTIVHASGERVRDLASRARRNVAGGDNAGGA